jgi:putative endonuclease
MEKNIWLVYILECKDGSLYTGVTENLQRRLKEHQKKTSHYTSYNPPVKVAYQESFQNKIDAEKREAQIKRWGRAKKLALIQGNFKKLQELSKSRD